MWCQQPQSCWLNAGGDALYVPHSAAVDLIKKEVVEQQPLSLVSSDLNSVVQMDATLSSQDFVEILFPLALKRHLKTDHQNVAFECLLLKEHLDKHGV